MEHIKPVFWYQGLFLQPQHFQQYDLYVQSLLNPLRHYLHPYFWGICRLQINLERLKQHIFELENGECVFRDGTWIKYPDNAVMQPRIIDKDEWNAGGPVKVFLGLPKFHTNRNNVTVIEREDDLGSVRTRFVSRDSQDEMRDMHNGGPAANVKLMDFTLRIFWEHEIPELTDYDLLPIAQLDYEDNTIRVSPNFIPPALTVSASDTLRRTVNNIRDQICSRCSKLEEYKTPKGIQTADIETNYITYLMALRSLARYVPQIHHLCEAEHTHPWDVYGLLRNIVGELSIYTDRIDARGRLGEGAELLPSYDHANLQKCFEDAQTLIGELLGSLVIGPESIIHLKRENGSFSAHVPGELFIGSHMFYLVIRTAEQQGKVLSVMERIAKVSSMEHMPILTGRALPGLTLVHSPLPPPGVPTRPNSIYFEIDQTHAQWSEIQKSQSICLNWTQAPKDTSVQLIVLRK